MRIAFDMDGVLADLHVAYVRAAVALFPELDAKALESPAPRDTVKVGDAPEDPDEAPEALAGVRLNRRQSQAVWDRLGGQENFWESLPEIEAGSVARINKIAHERRWEVLFITSRPTSKGDTVQRQTQRWLQKRGFEMPSVYVVHGSRGRVAESLELDVVVDDRPDNCLDVVLESKSGAVLVWRGKTAVPSTARRLGIAAVSSVGACLDAVIAAEDGQSDETFLDRLRRIFGVRAKKPDGLLRREGSGP